MTYPIFKRMPAIGNSIFMIFLAFMLTGSFSLQLNAQVTLPHAQRMGIDTCKTVKLETCGGTVSAEDLRWTDDGKNDGAYRRKIQKGA